MTRRGSVHLVGAGPGDAGLLTRRGEALLHAADVVIYDRLVGDDVLDLVPAGVELIDVGKDVGRHSVPQKKINELIIAHARLGRRVVRLKGGDPFIFGRGWEELSACAAAGIDAEVVPGVTSAIAGPAAAGIPVTARGIARSVTILTARAGDEFAEDDGPDFAALARLDTLVVMMGRAELRAFAASLIAAGKDPQTPAAIVESATLPGQRSISVTLSAIADAADEAGIQPPAVVVIGPTAAYEAVQRERMRQKPLDGRRVVITRPRQAGADAARRLRELGAEVAEVPLIRIEYTDAAYPIPAGRSGRYDWLVVTSLHGARGLARSLERAGLDARALAGARIAAVGPKTAAELYDVLRLRAEVVPDEHRATALVAALREHVRPHHRVLFPCGTLARDEVAAGLREMDADVHELRVYDTLPQEPTPAQRARIERWASDAHGIDAVLLYSPSAARSLAASGLPVGGAAIVCVGPTTARAAAEVGLERQESPIVPLSYGDDGVIDALLQRFAPQEVLA